VPPTDVLDTAAARDAVLADHGAIVERVLACADAVADTRESPITDGPGLADALEAALGGAGVLGTLPAVLATAVEAAGGRLSAQPVAAPPYVAVTSRGPILRATLGDRRLVVSIRAFEVERDPRRYVRGSADPAAALAVTVRD
jgi:hypothetical protein